MVNAVAEQPNMVNVMGAAALLLKTLTMAELVVPTPICIAPNKAEAVPAFFSKGINDNAEALGKVKPWHARKQNMQATMPVIVNTCSKTPVHITMAVITWHINAILMIWLLENLRSNKEFSWLAMINPSAMMANINPYCWLVTLYNSINTWGEPEIYAYRPAAEMAPVNA